MTLYVIILPETVPDTFVPLLANTNRTKFHLPLNQDT